jgi:hypothetical protein
MRKLIIAIGIIAAILAILISFRSQGEFRVMGKTLNLNIVASKISLENHFHDLLEVINLSSLDLHNESHSLAINKKKYLQSHLSCQMDY